MHHFELLQQAQTAAHQADWALLNRSLQHLLNEDYSPSSSDADRFALLLDLALQSLESGDFQDRWDIAKLFPSFGVAAIAPLLDLLRDADVDSEVQWFAIRILSSFNHPSVVTALVDLLKTSIDKDLNEMAVTTLAAMGSGAIEILTQLIDQDNTRRSALKLCLRSSPCNGALVA